MSTPREVIRQASNVLYTKGRGKVWRARAPLPTSKAENGGKAVMRRWLQRWFEAEETRLERELKVKVRRPDAVARLIEAELERGAPSRKDAIRRALARHAASQPR